MKKLRNFLLFTIFFIAILIINNKVKATSISISPENPKVGDTVTVTVTVPNVNTADVRANVSGVASGTIKVVGGDLSGNARNYSSSAQYKCEKEGTLSVNVDDNSTAVLNGTYVNVGSSKSVTVTAKTNNSNNGASSNSGSATNTPAAKSNVTTLSNLGIRPNDFSGFRAAKTSYSTEVPNDVESIEIYANKGQNGQTITGTGKKTLQEGTNTFNIVVTAEDGTSKKTYTLTVNRKAKDDTNNTTENSTINDNAIDNEVSNEMDDTNELENNIIEDNEAGNVVGNNNSNLQKENTIIIAIIAVIIIIIIIILIVEAIKKKRMKGEDDDEYQDIYDDNENNEINDFDTSSVPVALQGNEDKIENPKEEEKENKIDENLNSTIIQEPEENKEIEASEPKLDNEEPKKELKEMFEDEERPRRKGHSKGKRFK